MTKPILYSFWRSSCSWRVRIALNLKEIDYELRTVDIQDKKVHLNDDFKKINPIQKVPTLVIGGNTLLESMNIIYYLEENFSSKYRLLPQDKVQKARVREISEIIVSGIQPLQNIGLRQIPILSGNAEFVKFSQFWIRKGLTAIEAIVKNTSGEYSVGDNVSLADCCLVPQMYNAKKFKVDTGEFPTLEKVNANLEKIPAFSITHPHKQPDAPAVVV